MNPLGGLKSGRPLLNIKVFACNDSLCICAPYYVGVEEIHKLAPKTP
jgi:hypothetical protein